MSLIIPHGESKSTLTETPCADDVARACVAAAKVTQEDPLTLADGVGRFRLPALQALQMVFPSAGWMELGALLRVPKPVAALHQVKKGDWWPDMGARATEAALAALEGA